MNKKRLLTLMGGKKKQWWEKAGVKPVAAYQAIGASSYAASLVNLANPGTYNLTEGVGAVTWTSTSGWTGDGTNYLTTGITPANRNTTSLVRFSDFSGTSLKPFGFTNGGIGGVCSTYIDLYSLNDFVRYYNSSNLQIAPKLLSGVVGLAGENAYRNGTQETGTMTDYTVDDRYEFYLLASNKRNSPIGIFVGKIQAFIHFNSVLTPTQIATLTTLMANLA